MNQLDLDYQNLLKDILENGIQKNTRNGKVLSVFGRTIRHKFNAGNFPLLTTKKMAWKSIVTELLWFLRGDTHIKYLVDNDCNIWNGDAYQGYLKRINGGLEPASKERFIEMIKNNEESRVDANGWKIGELGPIYGKQWRQWQGWMECSDGTMGSLWYDQIKRLIHELKTNPDSRRMIVSAWNVGELDQMVLPPCHYGFQVYTRELSQSERFNWYGNKIGSYMHHDHIEQEMDERGVPKRAISLMYNARSQDVPLGTPFNIASYALLLEIIAKMVNMVPDELISNMGDCHIYLNQIDRIKEQITRTPYELPKLVHINTDAFYKSLSDDPSLFHHLEVEDFQIENYKSHPPIKIPLSN